MKSFFGRRQRRLCAEESSGRVTTTVVVDKAPHDWRAASYSTTYRGNIQIDTTTMICHRCKSGKSYVTETTRECQDAT